MSSPDTLARPAYRPYVVEVLESVRLGPSFMRVTLTGEDLEHFGSAGLDQRIKLLLPGADGRVSEIGQADPESLSGTAWYENWRSLPAEERSAMRTYTVRRIDPAARRLVIDFVLHHDPGPAGGWAEAAVAGDVIVVVGPDERSPHSRSGIDWRPGTARRLLLVGDETAVPAIGGIVESLGAGHDVDVFVEVPHADDIPEWSTAANARVRGIAREDAPHGELLIAAVQQWCAASADVLQRASAPRPQELADIDVDTELLWDSPEDADGDFYAWMAGEAATVKTLRRLLVSAHGVDRKRVAFMGYWRLGQAERQE